MHLYPQIKMLRSHLKETQQKGKTKRFPIIKETKIPATGNWKVEITKIK